MANGSDLGVKYPPIKVERVLVGERLEAYAEFEQAAQAAADTAKANEAAQLRFREAMARLCKSVAPAKDGG
jgi:hypothetical protein